MSNATGALFGRYVLVQSMGRGSMGEVWVAIDPDLDRKVALKILCSSSSAPSSPSSPNEPRERLLAKARAMARLTHPHVVTIHDVGEVEGQLFIAMEYVDGESLDAWLARGPYPWQEALAVLRQAGAGLAAAHDVGLVHRNFKPANVMIGSDARVRVLDFDLGRLPGKSSTIAAPQTPDYMSPEQHRGEPADARSDMFSFCVVLFEALYGARPFAGTSRKAIASNVMAGHMLEIAAEERAPAWVHRVVTTGLANDPTQRFDDMQVLLRAIERSPTQKRRRQRAVAGTLALGLGIIALALALAPKRQDPCDMRAARAQVWSPELEAQLRASVGGHTPAGSLASQRLSEGLDRATAAWSDAKVQLCRDRLAKRITPRLQQVRGRCLDERREAIVALTGSSAAGDHDDAALLEALGLRPYAALRSLGDPAQCIELGITLDDAPAPVEDRAWSQAALELALAPVGLDRMAAAELARVGVRANDDPQHTLLLGRLAAAAGDHVAAERDLHAVARATTGSRHELAVEAWLALVELELKLPVGEPSVSADQPARLEDAARLLDYAEALADPTEAALRSRLALLRGRLALARPLDQVELAMTKLDDAIEHAEFEPTRDPDLLAAMLSVRASLQRSPVAAAADRDRAQAVLREALGPT